MNDFSRVTDENAIPNTSEQGGDAISQTQSAQTQDPVLARLAKLEEQNETLKRQLQSQEQRVFNRMMKKMGEDEQAIRRVAELDGLDEKAVAEKIRKSREQTLLAMPLNEVNDLNEQTARTQQQYEPEQVNTVRAHRAALVNYLQSLGLSEADFGDSGVLPYAGKPEGSPEQKEFARKVGRLLDQREQAAQQYSRHMERQGIAEEMAEEMQTSGGLGGTTGNRMQGAGAAQQNALYLLKQEKQKFLGSGRGHEWLGTKAKLLEQYGLPPDTVV